MAHNRDYKPEDIAFPDQQIKESELVKEMEDSYIEYAMSVIVGGGKWKVSEEVLRKIINGED